MASRNEMIKVGEKIIDDSMRGYQNTTTHKMMAYSIPDLKSLYQNARKAPEFISLKSKLKGEIESQVTSFRKGQSNSNTTIAQISGTLTNKFKPNHKYLETEPLLWTYLYYFCAEYLLFLEGAGD